MLVFLALLNINGRVKWVQYVGHFALFWVAEECMLVFQRC
jgi:hypothetical protein